MTMYKLHTHNSNRSLNLINTITDLHNQVFELIEVTKPQVVTMSEKLEIMTWEAMNTGMIVG